MELFDPHGHRLYLAADERAAFLEAAKTVPREVRTFFHVLHDTGCRLSEALALPMRSVDLAGKVIVLETLKKWGAPLSRNPLHHHCHVKGGSSKVVLQHGQAPCSSWPQHRLAYRGILHRSTNDP